MRSIRDALGLCRLLYAVEADPARRERVLAADKKLAEAERFAGLEAGSLGKRRAVPLALEALTEIAALEWSADVAALLEAARVAVTAKKT